ncbi:MAG: hypothetical protein U0103_22620 [Candidatus Obscuribacterales bacterium]
MSKKDDEIQRKLQELESAVLKESTTQSQQHLTATNQTPPTDLISLTQKKNLPAQPVQNDLMYFSGIALILTGLFMFFNHVRVTGPFMSLLGGFGGGGAGIGLLFIPLMVGIGWLIYDSKNKIAWILTTASCAIVIFSVLSSITMQFPSLSFLGLIMMLLPFAAGGALLLKGMGGPKGIEQKIKKSE